MLRNIAFTSTLLGLTAAAPQGYGPPSYPSGSLQQTPSAPRSSPSEHHSSNGVPKPSYNGTGPYQSGATQVHHVTVTDHVTATDAGCAGGSASSAAGASGSYAPAATAISAAASNAQLPTYSAAGPPTGVSTPPANTLAPATGPSHDANNLTHLAPATSNNLYYANPGADTDLDHMFASLDVTFNKPAVVLENSAYVSNVTCSTDGIGVIFNGDQGYNYAKQQWPTFGNDFILVSHSDGCKDTSPNQRTFWQVTGAQFDDSSKACDVKCSEVGIDQAASDMTAQWGSYNQGGSNSAGGPGSPSQTLEAPVTSITPAPSYSPQSGGNLQGRDIWGDITSDFGDATSAVGSVVGDATSAVGSVVSVATSDAASVVSQVTSAAVSAADKSFSTTLTMDINASPTSTAGNAPWPSAAEIISVSGIDAYCVGCGAKGHADVSGAAEISFLQAKIKSGTFSMKGNLDATLGLGLDAKDGASFSPFSKEIQLVEIPLSPLEIPEILVIGPYINVDASVSVDMKAAGDIMVQVGASMPNFEATVDLLDQSKNKQSGFTPQWTKKFDASGSVTVSTTLGLPVELGFGLDVRALPSLKANVSITNTASVTAYGNYSNVPGPCMDGVGWGINFADDVEFDVFGLYSDKIAHWQSPDVASGCIGGKNQTSSTSSASDKPTNTPKSSPGTPGASATPTGKQSGKPYSPTYSPSPATGTPGSTPKGYSTRQHQSGTPSPSPIGSPYNPPKDSSSKSYPSSPASTTLATSKSKGDSSSESKTPTKATPTPGATYTPAN